MDRRNFLKTAGVISAGAVVVRRYEPSTVFGSVDSGVANPAGADGLTFLDSLWNQAPFANHTQFTQAVERISAEWRSRGLFTEAERAAILQAAAKAREDLGI